MPNSAPVAPTAAWLVAASVARLPAMPDSAKMAPNCQRPNRFSMPGAKLNSASDVAVRCSSDPCMRDAAASLPSETATAAVSLSIGGSNSTTDLEVMLHAVWLLSWIFVVHKAQFLGDIQRTCRPHGAAAPPAESWRTALQAPMYSQN